MIDNLEELENLIVLLKKYDIPLFKLDGLEININIVKTFNNETLEEKPKPKKTSNFDPDLFAHLPTRVKFRGESNDE